MTATTQRPAAPPAPPPARPRSGRTSRILRRKLRRDLRRQRWQFVAVVLTIVLGVMLFAASYDSFLNLSASYEQTYERLAFADLTVSGGDQESTGALAGANPDVEAVSQRIQADVPFQVDAAAKLIGRIVGMPVDDQPAVNQVDVLEGTYLDPDRPNGVLIDRHMAEHFRLVPGDRVLVLLADGPTEVTMLGKVASAEYLFPARSRQDLITTPEDFGVMFVPEDLAARAPPPTQIEQTAILYASAADRASLDAQLSSEARVAGAADITTQEDQPSNAALSEDLQGFSQLSFMFPALFLTAAGLATFIILNRIVRSQRAQIGTLAANGLASRIILRHFLSYGLVIGIVGSVVGVVAGVALGALITSAYTGFLEIPDTVRELHPITPIIGLVFGVVMGALAAWAPARAAVNTPPAEAMRGEAPPPTGRQSLVERAVPPLRRLPVRWRMTVRGIGRAKRRSLSTVIGVALAIVLILTSWGMIDTVQVLLDRQFDDIQHNDAQVFLAIPASAAVLAEIESVEGVAVAEGVLTLGATLRSESDQYATEMQGFEAGTQMHSFYTGSGEEIPLPEEGFLAGSSIKGLLDVDVGDTVEVGFPSLDTSLELPVAGFVDEPLGTYVYMDRGALVDALGSAAPPVDAATLTSPEVASAMVVYEDGVDADAVRDQLSVSDGVAAVITSNAIRDLMDDFLALFYAFVGVMLVFGGIMAFALIFNSISVNIAERASELANMRANGLAPKQINAMMSVENMILTLIGIPVGLVAGYWMASAFMSSFSSDLFKFELSMRPTTFLFTSLAIIVVTLISQRPGLRAVRRLDIATVVRERSQ